MPGPRGAGVGAEPASEDPGEFVVLLIRAADDVDGDLDEAGRVRLAVDLDVGPAGRQIAALWLGRKEQDRRRWRGSPLSVENPPV